MRSRFRPSHATVVAYLALFIALGGTTYAATGGNFILGQANTAGAPTQLSSPTTNSAGALKVTNTNTTTAGRGITAAGGAGGYGLYASGGSHSKNTAAIHGQSGAGNALEGYSTANPASGVFGQDNNTNSYGVAGHSDNGVAVVGDSSSGWAMQALGNTTQARAKSGFVKAMALVSPGLADPIRQCFNSQLPPSQATTNDCGITYSSSVVGLYHLDFGFQVNDRFASLTSQADRVFLSAEPTGNPSNTFEVISYNTFSPTTYTSFYIFVY
jgi:hypothetical protein